MSSLFYSNTMFVCVFVCLRPISSRTAGPIWLNFFVSSVLVTRWFQAKKKSGSGIRILRKSGKTRFLGYYLTDLAEILRKYSPLPKYVLKQINFWIGYPVFRIRNPVFPEKIRLNWAKSGLTVYHDVIHHFSYSNHGKFIFGTQFAIWRIFSKFLEDFSR